MSRYTLSDFNNILEKGNLHQLPDETIAIINMLAKQVGAPEYIKTPQFKKPINIGSNINVRRRKKPQELNDTDWETIRNFQATEFDKKEGIENNILLIRKYFNMITQKTYDTLKINITDEIDKIQATSLDSEINKDLIYATNEIFKMATNNILYSDIYAKLYKDLLNKYTIFNDILLENFGKFKEVFTTIEYYDPENDYEKFCENNKINETRRSLCSFYVNLMKEEVIDNDDIGNIILHLFDILNSYIEIKDKSNELDELSELIYIMVTNSYEILNKSNTELCKQIYDNVVKITNIKSKKNLGITNKCIFKHMDILDEIS